MFIVVLKILLDRSFEGKRVLVGTAADHLVRDFGEPAFELVDPGSVGWSEVEMEARPTGQPVVNQGCLACAEVVENEMDIEVLRRGLVDDDKELLRNSTEQ